MPTPKEKGQILSVGAKNYIAGLAKQHVYGYRPLIETKEMKKGLTVENESIALLNEVLFTNHKKNELRAVNDWLTGECDIHDETLGEITDVKSSWSLATFPATPDEGKDSGYEWQLRAYMLLYGSYYATLAYCMVDTPDELLTDWDDDKIHKVSHIDPVLRVTRLHFTRDAGQDSLIKQKVEAAQKYYLEAIEAIHNHHK